MFMESIRSRYATVFGHWQLREYLGSSAGGKAAVFRLVHNRSSSVESLLTVISLIEEAGSYDSLSGNRKAEYQQMRQQLRELAEQQVLKPEAGDARSDGADYLDHTFADWNDTGSFGFDMLVRTKLPEELRDGLRNGRSFTERELPGIGAEVVDALDADPAPADYRPPERSPEAENTGSANLFYKKDVPPFREEEEKRHVPQQPGAGQQGSRGGMNFYPPGYFPNLPNKDEQHKEKKPERKPVAWGKVLAAVLGTAALLALVLLALPAIKALPFLAEPDPVKPVDTQPPAQLVSTDPPVQPVDTAPMPSVPPTTDTQPPVPQLSGDNPYYDCLNNYDGYILPESATRYYAAAEINDLSNEELTVAYHEITARHGAIPKDTALKEYFSFRSWYTADSTASYTLNDYEQGNQILIDVILMKRDGSIQYATGKYISLYVPGAEYFLDSKDRYLDSSDLKDLSSAELILARNEVFARHGYIFGEMDIHAYFCCMDWYVPRYHDWDFDRRVFTEMDWSNISLILLYEQILSYRAPAADNPYMPYYGSNGTEYICPDSDMRTLSAEELEALDNTELTLALNEIYARHGLGFEYGHMLHYFLNCTWYQVDVAPGRLHQLKLNEVERINAAMLQEMIAKRGG